MKRHPLFNEGVRKLIARFVGSLPPPDYTVPKEGIMTTGYGLPGSGDIYEDIAKSVRREERRAGAAASLGLGYGTGKPKMVHTYMGVDVEDMDRRQLIDAVVFLGTQLQEANASAAYYSKHMFDGYRRRDR